MFICVYIGENVYQNYYKYEKLGFKPQMLIKPKQYNFMKYQAT